MMKKMVVEAQMESRADLERTALRVRGHVAGYEAEEWQQDIVIAHLTGLLELQVRPSLFRLSLGIATPAHQRCTTITVAHHRNWDA